MICKRTAGSNRWIGAALICALWVPFSATAQETSPGVGCKLERAGVIDAYLMGRNTDCPVIAQALRRMIGPNLYQQVIAVQASEKRRGAVTIAFPSSHPPDSARMQSIDTALRATPCGSGGLDRSLAQAQFLDM